MTKIARADGRAPGELRALRFTPGFIGSADGSCLVEAGRTRVICTVSIEEKVPDWLSSAGRGWLTAEYAMLPASTGRRKSRDGRKSVQTDGRSVEIQRLIGRALRAGVDTAAMPGLTFHVDCDVIEADGGTRVTSINGAWVALEFAVKKALTRKLLTKNPLRDPVAAVSVVDHAAGLLLDPDASEDQKAASDLNVVLAASGGIVDVQATAERGTLPPERFTSALELAREGIRRILAERAALTP